jgi:hypothetical protein
VRNEYKLPISKYRKNIHDIHDSDTTAMEENTKISKLTDLHAAGFLGLWRIVEEKLLLARLHRTCSQTTC